MKPLLRLALPALLLPLAACTIIPDAPIVAGTPRAELTPVAIDQPVRVGSVVVTPKRVVEDSRCPINARCVWPGRLIVETRVDGDGWRDTTNITLGETYATHGHVVALVSGEPGRMTNQETAPSQYRFVYEPR